MTWLDDKRNATRKRHSTKEPHRKRQGSKGRRSSGSKPKKERQGGTESLRPASEQKVNTSPLVVNMDTQTNQSAARVASRIPDETERDGFLNEYISHEEAEQPEQLEIRADDRHDARTDGRGCDGRRIR